ncbi:MAG: DMT family transporter [Planctomycetes bacterium]|nr:DMT family transporter [Planctomycetota bacterium]
MPPHVRLLLAGSLFATGGALIKLCGFPSLERAGVRAIFAALTLFVLLPPARRWPSRRILPLMLPYFGATVLFVVANTLTTAANAIFLQATAPLWVSLGGLVLLRERPSRIDLLVLVCIAFGMTLFFLAPAEASATAPDPRLGDWLAIGSGVSFGLLLIGFRWLGRQGQDEQCAAVAWGNLLTAPLALSLAPLLGQELIVGTAQDWTVIAVMGVFQVGLAYSLLVRAMPHVPAVQASLLLMIEPALNPVIAFGVHGERPHVLAIAGGVVIIAAVVLGSVLTARRAPRLR